MFESSLNNWRVSINSVLKVFEERISFLWKVDPGSR